MRYRVLIGCAVVVGAGIVVQGMFWASPAAAVTPTEDERAIQKAIDDYAAAFNKGDLKGVCGIWAPDAEYIDETGKSTKGHQAITAMFKNSLGAAKDVKVRIKTSSLRFFNDVAWQDGTAVLTQPGAEPDISPFTAIWTKKDGKWLLSLVREQSIEAADKDEPDAQLKSLAWLVGEWVHEDNDRKVIVTAKWEKGEKFLHVEWIVFHKGEQTMSVMQMVGWDPLAGGLHSWSFDAKGGFSEGNWTHKGNAWTAEAAGVTGDGRRGSGTHIWRLVDNDSFIWEGINRDVGGQALPDVSLNYKRVSKKDK